MKLKISRNIWDELVAYGIAIIRKKEEFLKAAKACNSKFNINHKFKLAQNDHTNAAIFKNWVTVSKTREVEYVLPGEGGVVACETIFVQNHLD